MSQNILEAWPYGFKAVKYQYLGFILFDKVRCSLASERNVKQKHRGGGVFKLISVAKGKRFTSK